MFAPAPHPIIRKMFEIAQVTPEDVVCDLGCGDGRMLISAVKEFGAKKAIGYEIKEDVCQICLDSIHKEGLEDQITLIKGDMLKADLSEVSLICLYVSVAVNEILRPKLESDANPGCRIISYLFPMTTWKASKEIELARYTVGNDCFREVIYVYTVPEAFA